MNHLRIYGDPTSYEWGDGNKKGKGFEGIKLTKKDARKTGKLARETSEKTVRNPTLGLIVKVLWLFDFANCDAT